MKIFKDIQNKQASKLLYSHLNNRSIDEYKKPSKMAIGPKIS